jgi:hypothetical protein
MWHSTGNAYSGGWNIFTNGYISTSHAFANGLSRVRVRALGQQANGVLPHMVVSVGGTTIGDANVTTAGFADYDFFYVSAGASQEVRVAFDNDFVSGSADRNLIVDKVIIECDDAFLMSSGSVSVEAESFHASSPNGSADSLTLASSAQASSGQYMLTGPDNGNLWTSNVQSTAPRLDYNVNFTAAGTYFVHVRGDAPNGAGDSCFIGVDASINSTFYDFSDTPNTWGWVTHTITVSSSGIHTVHLWPREDGFRADKIVINTSATAPSGVGPAQSPEG